MYKITGAVFLLLLTTMLTAENWLEIGFQTFSKTENDVTSYDVTSWTGGVEFGGTDFDSICVIAHSEKINDSTSALVFSRWFFKNDFCATQVEEYVLQDTVIMEAGALISQVKFPVCNYMPYPPDSYNFDYLYFCRTKNGQSDFCRVKYLGNGKFAPYEIIITNLAAGSTYSTAGAAYLYNNNKLFLKNLESGSVTILDSDLCKNPQFHQLYYSYLSWEKTDNDTVKTFYTNYNESNQTYGEIKQFYHGEVYNLHISDSYSIWELGTGSNRKTFYSNYGLEPTESTIMQFADNPQHFQTASWYYVFSTYQISDENSNTLYFDGFSANRSYHIDSIATAINPSLKIVAALNVMAYAPWTFLQEVNGKYQLQSKMLYFPEVGIEENSNNPQNAILIENYPNPFNNSTRINFLLPKNGMTTISVYNNSGQFVKNLKREMLSAGIHNLEFKADELNSGLYFVRIENSGLQKVHKILLTK